MKIVLINTVYGTGSTGKIAADLYETIDRAGGQPLFVSGRNRLPAGIEGCLAGNRMDFYGHVLQNFCKGENGFGSIRSTKRLIEWLTEKKPDLIHLHNIHGFYLQVELLFDFLKKNHIPVVWTLHDCYPYTGHCAYYDRNHCDGFLTGCKQCAYHAKVYPYALFRDNAAESFQRKQKAFTGAENLTVVTPSRWLAGEVGKSFLKEYPVKVIANGIDTNIFKLPVSGTEMGGFRILGVANNWEERKGLVFFEKLAELLPAAYHITLIGLSAKQRKRLKRQFSEERLTALGRTESREALAAAYGEADVFVNPTLEDNFPTTNLEALACGTPVVTFETGGSPETIDDTCGITVEQGNVQALAEAVITACTKPFGEEACRARAMKYDGQKQYAEYMKLYGEVLQKGK